MENEVTEGHEVTRRIGDYHTWLSFVTLSPQSDVGSGFFDIISKIGSKLTGKTASKLASKAAEKLIEKGAEKTGEVLGGKIHDKLSSKRKNQPIQTHEIKGEIRVKRIREAPSEA